MKILLTGTSGYIGKRLLIQLMKENHQIVCSVRDRNRFSQKFTDGTDGIITVIENDFLRYNTLGNIPVDIDAAYFLIHSMASSDGDFSEKGKLAAENFRLAKQHYTHADGSIGKLKMPVLLKMNYIA